MAEDDAAFYAYEIHASTDMPITAASQERDWMDRTDRRFAYRCLPLVIANQAGWMIHNPTGFVAVWDGTPLPNGVRVWYEIPNAPPGSPAQSEWVDPRISSHFGSGIVTINVPYLFRTPRSICLWAKGPANAIKDGVQPLEGIIETDWLPATFTMNWKLTRPGLPVHFRRGEPICMVVPLPRGLAEGLDPIRLPLAANPEVAREYGEWDQARKQFLGDLKQNDPDAVRRGWQKHYFKGETLSGDRAEAHQTRLKIREFRVKES